MKHFYAKVNKNYVEDIRILEDQEIENLTGTWIKTSPKVFGGVVYDLENMVPLLDQSVKENDKALKRKNFAQIGGRYYPKEDMFVAPQLFESWELDFETGLWIKNEASD